MSIKNYQGLLSRLCREMARYYVAREDAIAMAARIRLDISDIRFSSRSIDSWRSIIMHALESDKLLDLVQLALRDYPESNVILEAVHSFYMEQHSGGEPRKISKRAVKRSLRELLELLDQSYMGFRAQSSNRDKLKSRMMSRLDITDPVDVEDFFPMYYAQMNRFERRMHRVIREYTELIKISNHHALEIIETIPHIEEKIPKLKSLKRHLRIWLHKFDKVFLNDHEMCLLYTNLYDRVPFPRGVEAEIKKFLKKK